MGKYIDDYIYENQRLTADRDRWKAEVNEYKDASEDWESIARSMTQERDAMTALAERYKRERDELISLLVDCHELAAEGVGYTDKYFRDKWGMDDELKRIKDAINNIQEADNGGANNDTEVRN